MTAFFKHKAAHQASVSQETALVTFEAGYVAYVTGTSGKTSTVNLLGSILEAHNQRVESYDSLGIHSTGLSLKPLLRELVKRPMLRMYYSHPVQNLLLKVEEVTQPWIDDLGPEYKGKTARHILNLPTVEMTAVEVGI